MRCVRDRTPVYGGPEYDREEKVVARAKGREGSSGGVRKAVTFRWKVKVAVENRSVVINRRKLLKITGYREKDKKREEEVREGVEGSEVSLALSGEG